jgi:hypothetical protein
MNALAHRRKRRMERKAPTGAAIQQVQRPWGVQGRRDAYRLTDEPFHIVALESKLLCLRGRTIDNYARRICAVAHLISKIIS